jgi:hypothetical protein
MTRNFAAVNKLALLIAAGAFAAVIGNIGAASAQSPKHHYDDGRPNYGPGGPNASYMQGPHTRIYVSKRSWLDGGTEVLPGDRKFSDYAFPMTTPFDQQLNNRSLVRQPLNPPSDMGGLEPTRFPLY